MYNRSLLIMGAAHNDLLLDSDEQTRPFKEVHTLQVGTEMSEGGMAITEPILPGQDAASQLSAPFESDARPTVVNEPAADTQSAGSSAVAERSTKPIYLPVRTLSSVSHQAEALEGCELK